MKQVSTEAAPRCCGPGLIRTSRLSMDSNSPKINFFEEMCPNLIHQKQYIYGLFIIPFEWNAEASIIQHLIGECVNV